MVFSSCSNVKYLQMIYGNSRQWQTISAKELPLEVKYAFDKKYHEMASVIWLHPTKNKYVAHFSVDGKITLVVFSASGVAQDEENYEPDDYYYDDDYDEYWEMGIYD